MDLGGLTNYSSRSVGRSTSFNKLVQHTTSFGTKTLTHLENAVIETKAELGDRSPKYFIQATAQGSRKAGKAACTLGSSGSDSRD